MLLSVSMKMDTAVWCGWTTQPWWKCIRKNEYCLAGTGGRLNCSGCRNLIKTFGCGGGPFQLGFGFFGCPNKLDFGYLGAQIGLGLLGCP